MKWLSVLPAILGGCLVAAGAALAISTVGLFPAIGIGVLVLGGFFLLLDHRM
jgi:hypothetical protein